DLHPFGKERAGARILASLRLFEQRLAHVHDLAKLAAARHRDRDGEVPDVVGEVVEHGHVPVSPSSVARPLRQRIQMGCAMRAIVSRLSAGTSTWSILPIWLSPMRTEFIATKRVLSKRRARNAS